MRVKRLYFGGQPVKAVYFGGKKIYPKGWDGTFKDPEVQRIMMENFDKDGDGRLNEQEVAAVTSLGRLFYENKKIAYFDDFRFLKNVTNVDDYCFKSCSNLISVKLPPRVKRLGISSFEGCVNLEHIGMNDGITEFSDSCLRECEKIEKIILPKSVNKIHSHCFSTCSNLKVCVIPDAVTEIGYATFQYDQSLEAVIMFPKSPPKVIGDFSYGSNLFYDVRDSARVYVHDDRVSSYRYAWRKYAGRITPLSELPDEYKYLLDD